MLLDLGIVLLVLLHHLDVLFGDICTLKGSLI